MADIDVVREPAGGSSPRNMSWLWAVIAVLAVGGLMAWLAVQSDRITTAAVVQEEDDRPAARADATPGAVEGAELGVLAADPEPFVGRQVRVDDVEVAASLGPSAFWGDVPGANPFLVLFSPNLTEQPQLDAGQTYTVQGVINVVTDSALNAWVQDGAIRPGARDEAAFATHYLLAERIIR